MPVFHSSPCFRGNYPNVLTADHRAWAALCCIAMLGLSLGTATGARAAEPWRVVILPGADPTQPAAAQQIQALRRELVAAAPDGVEFYTDALDGLRFSSAPLLPEFLALMRKKYEGRKVDIVIGLSDFALTFTRRYHDEIWPGVPVLITSMEEPKMRELGLPADFAFVPWHIDVDGTLDIAERLQPAARRLVVVTGTSDYDRDWAPVVVAAAGRRTARHWRTEVWSGLSVPELRQRLASLDQNASVFYAGMHRDHEGRTHFPYEVVRPMASVSRAPIYSWYPTYLDHGLAAGSMIDFVDNGRRTATLAADILKGTRMAAGASVPARASSCFADAGQLEALGLPVTALPANCTAINVPMSIWREYRATMLAVAGVLLLQAMTISALLWQRRYRRAAEDEAVRRRGELARAARFASVGELGASIAHEVGQPLGAILSNADAVGLMLDAGTPDTTELHEILTDIRRDALRANQVMQRVRAMLRKQTVVFEPVRLDASCEETIALLGPEARRRGVDIDTDFRCGGARIMGDRVQLQQVALNLMMNAMDAMKDRGPGQRQLHVSTHAVEAGVLLQVADCGHGIDEAAVSKLFESFYTTKPHGMGLGLAIVRTIVEAHGGKVSAAPRENGGSVFSVWLPSVPAAAEFASLAPARNDCTGAVDIWPERGGEHP